MALGESNVGETAQFGYLSEECSLVSTNVMAIKEPDIKWSVDRVITLLSAREVPGAV